jgi:hypothetical protein
MGPAMTVHDEDTPPGSLAPRAVRTPLSALAVVLAVVALAAIVGGFYWNAARTREAPRAVVGTLDLSSWSFEHDGNAALVGEWGFYWSQLLAPGAALPPRPPRLLSLPETWRSAPDPDIPGRGFASHTLRIRLPPEAVGRELGLTVGEVASASRLYIDGRLARENGRVGTNAGSEIPSVRPGYVRFTPERTEVDLLLQVSNYFRHDGDRCRSSISVSPPVRRRRSRARRGSTTWSWAAPESSPSIVPSCRWGGGRPTRATCSSAVSRSSCWCASPI